MTNHVRFTKIKKGYYPFPVWEFNLPAGWSCPFAKRCMTKADKETGKIKNGIHQTFSCYAARVERWPNVRDTRWLNFEALRYLKTKQDIVSELSLNMPKATHLRIHGGGDFFSQLYFDSWLDVVAAFPGTTFWAFTKSIRYWVARIDQIPSNLTLQASYGGSEDHLIEKHQLKFAKVFPSMSEVEASGLPLDTDDTLAMTGASSFALLDNYSKDRGKGQTLLF